MLQPGSKLKDRYEITSVLGEGGMGFVYLALDRVLGGKKVAVKEMAVHIHRDDEKQKALRQFRDEAHLLASLEHPRLVPVSDFFEDGDNAYLVMSYIDGTTLATAITERDVPLVDLADWVDQICEVLEYLHDHEPPVLFRDLKPSNVMLDRRGQVRLIDFGIARTLESGQSTSTFLKGAGTAEFAPVEQFSGRGTEARSDIYSLGATMFNLFTGELPPISVDVIAGESPPADPRAVNPAIPPDLDAIIRKAMALKKEDRYATVRELRLALNALPRAELQGLGRAGAAPVQPLPTSVPTVLPQAPAATAMSPSQGGATLQHGPAGGATATLPRPAPVAPAAAPIATPPPPPPTGGGARSLLTVGLLLVVLVGAGVLASGWYSANGRLKVSTTPEGARVWLDDNARGNTPLTLSGLRRGMHHLKIEKEGMEPQEIAFSVDAKRVDVRPGFSGKLDESVPSMPHLALTLQQKQGALVVNVTPEGADVYVDGQLAQSHIMSGSSLAVPVGPHRVKLAAVGYKSVERIIDIKWKQTQPISAALESSMSTLSIDSQPSGATVEIGGKRYPVTPTRLELTPGRHTLRVSKSGYEPFTAEVTLVAGQNHGVIANLTRLAQATARPTVTDVPTRPTVVVDVPPSPAGGGQPSVETPVAAAPAPTPVPAYTPGSGYQQGDASMPHKRWTPHPKAVREKMEQVLMAWRMGNQRPFGEVEQKMYDARPTDAADRISRLRAVLDRSVGMSQLDFHQHKFQMVEEMAAIIEQ